MNLLNQSFLKNIKDRKQLINDLKGFITNSGLNIDRLTEILNPTEGQQEQPGQGEQANIKVTTEIALIDRLIIEMETKGKINSFTLSILKKYFHQI